MSKQILAAFMVSLFVLSAALVAAPTWAHTTLGVQTNGNDPNNMFRAHDVDTNLRHVFGPTGYVFPGSGKDWITGMVPEPTTEFPGYQSPWSNYPLGAPNTNWWQLRGTSYAPFGAVLTSTDDYDNVGDLIFAVNFTDLDYQGAPFYYYDNIKIYIPPEFQPVAVDWADDGDDSNIISTLTNDWDDIGVSMADVKDPFAPGWWKISVDGDINFTADYEYGEWYYIRVNGLAAPKIAGKYFFKVFMNTTYPRYLSDSVESNPPGLGDDLVDTEFIERWIWSTMPVENWPVLLVKGEIDPGIAYGTVRFGGYDADLYGLPIPLAGVVRFVGEAIDPYTSEPTGRMVEARGYFNGTAQGHFEVEGIAPGIYSVYASVAGYPESLVAENQMILPGKSLHLDIYLNPGAVIHGEVFAKHKWGATTWDQTAASWWWAWYDEVWMENWGMGQENWVPDELGDTQPLPVTVEIYDSNEWPEPAPGYVWGEVGGTVPDNYLEFEQGTLEWTDEGYQRNGHLKSFSPTNLTDSPFTSYNWGPDGTGNPQPNPIPVAFPWDTIYMPDPINHPASDVRHNGVGPTQVWWAAPAANNFAFQFGSKDLANNVIYGAPTDYDGHVPQVFATWINGLEAGTYYARVWIAGFVQTDAQGNYMDYMFTVGEQEWAANIDLWIDVQLNGYIMKEVHFHDLPGTIDEAPITGPDDYRWLVAEVRDASGNLVAFNFVPVRREWSSVQIPLWGFGWSGYEHSMLPNPWTDTPADETMWSYFLYKYRHIRDYGMMPGTYTVYVYMRGYVQQEFEMASITLSGDETYISNHMYRGAGINVTAYSMDSELPPVFKDWSNPGEDIDITVLRVEDDADMGDIKYWDCEGSWETPTQEEGVHTVPYAGWTGCSYLKFNGSTSMEADGPDANKNAANTGWDQYQDEVYNEVGDGFVGDASYYRDDDFYTVIALETGEYYFDVGSSDYVYKHSGPDDKFVVYAAKGQQADGPLKLVIGAWINGTIIFKKENIFDHARWNITVVVRIFDDSGEEVASADGDIEYCTEAMTFSVSGLDAYPNYDGDWTIETETWIDYWGSYHDFELDAWFGWGEYRYGIPDALLSGYGYRVIAGEVRGDYDYNHLGPYSQNMEIVVPNIQLGGEASPVFELDLMGYVTGQVAGYSWSTDMRTISWASIMVSGAGGDFIGYTFDGEYEMFVPPGDDYLLTVEEWPGDVGHKSVSVSMSVPDGGAATQNFLNLEQSEVSIPEFPVALLPTLAALGSSIYLLRRRR